MANFKRGKTKRRVRCTLCTKHRWLGNGKERRKASEQQARRLAKQDMTSA